ncbi:unnamed protein product [Clonostachys solani]|uniref:F-box domain-containing protein n=1 Tax=Clonostachys solani TaxID=160281 RepID=A0A9N9Z5V9_9HYPO|nr:unnamed protein product [Clonostachys solani]
MSFLDLPYSLFWEIIAHLPAVDALVCRRLSTGALRTLTSPEVSLSLLLLHFPRSREGRLLRDCIQNGAYSELKQGHSLAPLFARLTRRYYHLGNATPWRTREVQVLKDDNHLHAVHTWDRVLSRDGELDPFQAREPLWAFGTDEALLVYPSPDGQGFLARDLHSQLEARVPFDVSGKVIRRVRLNSRILIVEWCEEQPCEFLNSRVAVYRHYATAFDLTPASGGSVSHDLTNGLDVPEKTQSFPWSITWRSEWKIHDLGILQDRFFSAHNATHYAIYIWQSSGGLWGVNDPRERLMVYELGEATPEFDSTGDKMPVPESPRLVQNWMNSELSTLGVRQRISPKLRGIYLDAITWNSQTKSACGHIFVHEEDHRNLEGPHRGVLRARHHHVKSTGIPLTLTGPKWVDECGCEVIGDSLSSLSRGGTLLPHQAERIFDPPSWPGRAPCWRHRLYPWLTLSEVLDADAGIRIAARHSLYNHREPELQPVLFVQGVDASHFRDIETPGSSALDEKNGDTEDVNQKVNDTLGKKRDGRDGYEVQFSPYYWGRLMTKGTIYGDERWLMGEGENGTITILQF